MNKKPLRIWLGVLALLVTGMLWAGQLAHGLAFGSAPDHPIYVPVVAYGSLPGGTIPAETTPTETATPMPTPTICPQATPQPLWVEPVVSPTNLLTQTITVYLGDGEQVTVTSESGTFTTTGDFTWNNNPALVTIDLLPDTMHHLTVSGRVKLREQGGCTYGGYTLTTQSDRFGQPLLITQVTAQ